MPRQPRTFAQNIGLKSASVACNPDWRKKAGERHHIFLFDGTWNDETGPNPVDFNWDKERHLWQSRANPLVAFPPIVTNLVQTNHALAADGETQLTHYFRGVGNDDENDAANTIGEGALSHSERLIRNAAYCELLKSSRQGDRLSILGFSRGAASARLFAAYVRKFGILDEVTIESRFAQIKNTGQTWEEVWNLFTNESDPVVEGGAVPVAFLGVWDTVATSISAPDADWAVPDTTGRAVQCLALDETRNLFGPTLLSYTEAQAPNVKEVWFPGVHSDVGGGYFHNALSRVTLKFMWQNWNTALAAQNLAPLNWNEPAVAQATDTSGQPFVRHSEEASLTGKLGGNSPRRCAAFDGRRPRVHRSVEDFVQQEDVLHFCNEENGFPPQDPITSPPYKPAAYPGAAEVELYDSTGWSSPKRAKKKS